ETDGAADPHWRRSKRCPRRSPDRVGAQRQVAADPRTLHAPAALARHALPVWRGMAAPPGNPPRGGGFRRRFHHAVPFLVRKTSRRTWSGAWLVFWRASLMELSSEEPTKAVAGRVVCTSAVPPPSLSVSVRPSLAGSKDGVAANRPRAVTRNWLLESRSRMRSMETPLGERPEQAPLRHVAPHCAAAGPPQAVPSGSWFT